MAAPLNAHKALTFDCYGTLIDWESGIWDAFQPLFMANAFEQDRQTSLQAFARLESGMQARNPDMLYPQILKHVHESFGAGVWPEYE